MGEMKKIYQARQEYAEALAKGLKSEVTIVDRDDPHVWEFRVDGRSIILTNYYPRPKQKEENNAPTNN